MNEFLSQTTSQRINSSENSRRKEGRGWIRELIVLFEKGEDKKKIKIRVHFAMLLQLSINRRSRGRLMEAPMAGPRKVVSAFRSVEFQYTQCMTGNLRRSW